MLCAGDSVTRGVPGPVEESYPTRLGERLPGTDIVNLGRPGSSASEALERVMRYAPPANLLGTTVVWLAGFNDCAELQTLPHGPPPQLPEWVDRLGHSRTMRLLAQIGARLQTGATTAPPPGDPRYARCASAVREGVQQIREQTRRRGWSLVVLTYPLPAHPTPGLPESGWITPAVNAAIRAQAKQDGTPMFDTEICVQAAEVAAGPLVSIFTPDELHLTRVGHGALSACVAEAIDLTN